MALRIAARVNFHTADQVQGYADEACRIATELELTPEDRAALLPGILSLLSQQHVELEQTTLAAPGPLLRPAG